MPRSIDDISQIPLETVNAADLGKRGYLHRGKSTGTGREKITRSRQGVETNIGDIEIHVWEKAAKAAIHRDGLDEELEHLTEFYVGDVGPSLKEEYYRRAVSMVLTGAYKDPCWYGFIPYSRAYHPELLETAHLVQIVTESCQFQEMTEEALAREAELGDRIRCPGCGVWTTYQRITGGEEDTASGAANQHAERN